MESRNIGRRPREDLGTRLRIRTIFKGIFWYQIFVEFICLLQSNYFELKDSDCDSGSFVSPPLNCSLSENQIGPKWEPRGISLIRKAYEIFRNKRIFTDFRWISLENKGICQRCTRFLGSEWPSTGIMNPYCSKVRPKTM